MKILYRYLATEFVRPLIVSTSAFGGLVMLSEFFRELNFYMEKKASIFAVAQYMICNLPWWTVQVMPVAVLLSVLFSLGSMSRTGEITALKAAGVNLWRVIAIFAVIGIFLGVTDALLRESIIPYATRYAEKVRKEKIHKREVNVWSVFSQLVISLPSNGRMTVGSLDAGKGTMDHIVIDYYDNDFNLKNQIVAELGFWKNNEWYFKNGVKREFHGGLWIEKNFDEKLVVLPFKTSDLVVRKKRSEEMTSGEFLAYINQLETVGLPAREEKIKFQQRLAGSFSYLIVMMVGIPFALGMGSKSNKMLSFTFAMVFAFLYWTAQALAQSLGENGIISPVIAAWVGNLVFGVVGIVLLGRVKK